MSGPAVPGASAPARVADAVWAGLVLAVGACAFGPAYRGTVLAVPVVVGVGVAVVAVVLALVAGARRLHLPTSTTVLAVVLLAVAAAVLVADPGPAADPGSWRATPGLSLVAPVVDGVPRLLSAPRPAPASAALLAPTVLLTALVALAVAVLVVRSRPVRAAPLAGGAALYGVAALLTAGRSDPDGVLAAVLVLTAAGGLVLPRRRGAVGPRARLRAVGVALAPVVAVAALATTAAALHPGGSFEPRDLVARPRVAVQLTSPLPQLATWGDQTDLPLLRVGGAHPELLPLAVLPDFSGSTWRLDADLREPGEPATADLPPGVQRSRVDLQVTELGRPDAPDEAQPGLDLGWLPTAGRAAAVSGLGDGGVALDADSGAVVDVAAARAADGTTRTDVPPPHSYTVTGEVDTPSDDDLSVAGVPSGEAARRYLEVPSATPEIVDYAQAGTAVARSRLEQAVALEELVRNGRSLDPAADAGSSVARVQQFLFGPAGSPGAQRGSSEQFAAAYALLARSVGLPTRLVVGFRVPAAGADGTAVVTSADARAWPEVYFTGGGWVAFDPTPSAGDGPGDSPGQQLLDRLGGPDPLEPSQDPADSAVTPVAVPSVPVPGTSPVTVVLTAGAGTVTLLALLGAVLAALRTARRRRLRSAGAVGAWQQVGDALVLAGLRPPPGRSSVDVADDLVARTGVAGVRTLVLDAERAAYAPGGDPDVGADGHWAHAVAVGRELRRGSGRGRRLLWAVAPGPLRTGRRGSRRGVRPGG